MQTQAFLSPFLTHINYLWYTGRAIKNSNLFCTSSYKMFRILKYFTIGVDSLDVYCTVFNQVKKMNVLGMAPCVPSFVLNFYVIPHLPFKKKSI